MIETDETRIRIGSESRVRVGNPLPRLSPMEQSLKLEDLMRQVHLPDELPPDKTPLWVVHSYTMSVLAAVGIYLAIGVGVIAKDFKQQNDFDPEWKMGNNNAPLLAPPGRL